MTTSKATMNIFPLTGTWLSGTIRYLSVSGKIPNF